MQKENKRPWETDPLFRMEGALRARTASAFKSQGLRKSRKTFELLGCTAEQLRQHLSSKFVPGMSIQNWGEVWDIDHVIPCSAWDLSDPAHVRACFHWSNLQPLWSYENRYRKSGAQKYPPDHFRDSIAAALKRMEGL